jgi:hypothetical protein
MRTIYRDVEVTTYRDGTSVHFKSRADTGEPMFSDTSDPNEWGHYYRGDTKICESKRREGAWYWHLDDGHKDVGPFISEDAALADAEEKIDYCIEVYGIRHLPEKTYLAALDRQMRERARGAH